jgi:hypothetical protein
MDEFIVKQLKNLQKIRPSASLLEQQRSFLLSEISKSKAVKIEKGFSIFSIFNFSKILKPAYAIAFVLIILVSSLATISVINAAQNSLPGDPLYAIKTSLEKTQMTLASSQETKVKLSIKFANQRVDEFTQVAAKPEKQQDIEKTVKNFTEQLLSVQDNVSKLKDKNVQKAAEIAKIINGQTTAYAQTLIETSENLADILPEQREKIKSEIDQALIEVNNIKHQAEEIIKSQADDNESGTLIPAPEEETESKSIPFENINQ